MHFLKEPWPWYVSGPLIGLMVPLLLVLGNKTFGISSSFRHICAACLPANIPFFKYDWKKEIWNFFFVGGIILGGWITVTFLSNHQPVQINPKLVSELQSYGITNYTGLMPSDILNWPALFTAKGFVMMVLGGFLIGFGTRYAGGCTSGHSITGMSTLQWPSLVATCSFLAGGFVVANLVVPVILG
jgi:uncharacterized protein